MFSYSGPNTNQVFAASRHPFKLGDIAAPTLDVWASSNFLHIQFWHTTFELVGLRVPAYDKAADRDAYWAELGPIMRAASSRPIAFLGDINRNPFTKAANEAAAEVRLPECELYRIPNPTGDWSHISTNGTGTGRIDHVLHTEAVHVEAAEYCDSVRYPRVLAGPTHLPRPWRTDLNWGRV